MITIQIEEDYLRFVSELAVDAALEGRTPAGAKACLALLDAMENIPAAAHLCRADLEVLACEG